MRCQLGLRRGVWAVRAVRAGVCMCVHVRVALRAMHTYAWRVCPGRRCIHARV